MATYDPSYDNSPITRVALTDSAGQPIPGTGSGSSSSQVQGTAADNAAAVGNPVLTGAEYNATPQSYTDGDVANNQADSAGNLKVAVSDTVNSVNVLKSDGTAAGQNAELVAGTYLSVPFTTTTAQAVATTDVGNYSHVSVHVTSHGTSSTITFQCSDDNVNWFQNILENTTPIISATSSVTGVYMGVLRGRYFRLNVTGISAGTTAGVVVFSTEPKAPTSVMVASASSTGSAVPSTAYYLGVQSSGSALTGVTSIGGQADAATGNSALSSGVMLFNGATYDRAREMANATNSTGIGILATGLVGQLDDTSPTSITENQFGNLRMSADRSLLVAERSTTPAITSVAASASSVSLLAANNARKGAVITNDSSAVLYVKFGATASTTSYTVTIAGSASAPFSSYEVPFGYVGAIDGIWASATGNARITEIV